MEVSDLRKEISKCLQLAYKYGNIEHIANYKNDIDTLDEIMASYFGIYYNEETEKYE